MTPQDWTDVVNGLLLALGAAMAIGTGMALARFRRTGAFPGQPTDEAGRPVGQPSVRGAWAKVGIGVLLAAWGLAGLVAGTVIGT